MCTGGLQLAASDDICNLPTEICLPANDDCKTGKYMSRMCLYSMKFAIQQFLACFFLSNTQELALFLLMHNVEFNRNKCERQFLLLFFRCHVSR